jgi:hypothetical protein
MTLPSGIAVMGVVGRRRSGSAGVGNASTGARRTGKRIAGNSRAAIDAEGENELVAKAKMSGARVTHESPI